MLVKTFLAENVIGEAVLEHIQQYDIDLTILSMDAMK
jgi:hypothetical protein